MTDYSSFGTALNTKNELEEDIPAVAPIPTASNVHAHGTPFLAGFELWAPPTPNTYGDGVPVYELLGTD